MQIFYNDLQAEFFKLRNFLLGEERQNKNKVIFKVRWYNSHTVDVFQSKLFVSATFTSVEFASNWPPSAIEGVSEEEKLFSDQDDESSL